MDNYSFDIQIPAIGHPDEAKPKVIFTCTFTAETFGDANELAAKLGDACMVYAQTKVQQGTPCERSYVRKV